MGLGTMCYLGLSALSGIEARFLDWVACNGSQVAVFAFGGNLASIRKS